MSRVQKVFNFIAILLSVPSMIILLLIVAMFIFPSFRYVYDYYEGSMPLIMGITYVAAFLGLIISMFTVSRTLDKVIEVSIMISSFMSFRLYASIAIWIGVLFFRILIFVMPIIISVIFAFPIILIATLTYKD